MDNRRATELDGNGEKMKIYRGKHISIIAAYRVGLPAVGRLWLLDLGWGVGGVRVSLWRVVVLRLLLMLLLLLLLKLLRLRLLLLFLPDLSPFLLLTDLHQLHSPLLVIDEHYRQDRKRIERELESQLAHYPAIVTGRMKYKC